MGWHGRMTARIGFGGGERISPRGIDYDALVGRETLMDNGAAAGADLPPAAPNWTI